ncbi:hypothetical protein ALP36_03222 [Pseudomonas syringae pv. coriandricola]|uniref:Uncharacterized protein n=1 Tax=Pseudomonas syringae pv. coriandricola TaxID=264453 RepID=A0A3M4U8I3_9PSED|nr:hypothetical protein [Pseudomonas syringae group genomosp. 3]RMR35656.1 hypothetical protein ALP87_00969 [Pseudomonas syringae pv. coriandricola]RMU03569.1 hypothetical protein ALP36_03222 [Pseudomonas syringae pv. coriandricola]
MTIIKDTTAITNHPHEKLSSSVLTELKTANSRLKKTYSQRTDRVLRILECILQVSGLSITYACLGSTAFTITIQYCIGLLLSGRILDGSVARNVDYARHIGQLHDSLHSVMNSTPELELGVIMNRKNAALRDHCIDISKAIIFDSYKVWVWGGWTVENQFHTMHLNFFEVQVKMGRDFTEKLYSACTGYFKNRTTCTIECLDSLALFLSSDLCPYTPKDLQNQKKSRNFLVQLAHFHIQFNLGKEEAGKREVSQAVLIDDWNAHFRTFVANYLIPCKVIAAPCSTCVTIQDIPMIPGAKNKQARRLTSRTKSIDSGAVVKLKTITPLPMHAMDDSVIEALFVQLRHDYKAVVRWAELCIQSIEERLDELATIALESRAGIPRANKSNLSDAMLLSERIKTAHKYFYKGFHPKRTFFTKCISPTYNLSSSDLTEWLCLPKSEMLAAFSIYIAAKHEEVTNSFLDKCLIPTHTVLPNGKIKLVDQFLTGAKPRAKMAEQQVELCSETQWAVEVLIRLTNPIRMYLEQQPTTTNVNKKLFISTGKGFGKPKSVITKNMTGSVRSKSINAMSMQTFLNICEDEASYLAGNTSVNTVRATSVVLQVIDHLDLTLATDKLKHALFDLRLLEHYIPKLILLYLMRREINSWNTRVLIQALDSHPNTATIAGFRNKAELDIFLSNAMDLPFPQEKKIRQDTSSNATVVIGLDEQVICVLASLEKAVILAPDRVTPNTLYWAGLYGALRKWIYSSENHDSYLEEIFEIGTSMSDIQLVEAAAYVQ